MQGGGLSASNGEYQITVTDGGSGNANAESDASAPPANSLAQSPVEQWFQTTALTRDDVELIIMTANVAIALLALYVAMEGR